VNSALSGRHPGDDLLADLAAEVLPETQARTIEAHVIGCARCADLLSDAESVRRLLVTDDPGPMPLEVLARIEAALQAEAAARAAGGDHLDARGPGVPAGPLHSVPPTGPDAPWGNDWADGTGVQGAVPGAAPTRLDRPGRVARSVRPGGSGPRNRRDARPERPAGFLQRKAGVLLGAAAALVVVGATGVVLSQLGGGNATTAASMTGEAAPGGAAASSPSAGGFADVRYLTSRSQYTTGNLAARAREVLLPAADGPGEARTATRTAAVAPSAATSVTIGPAQALRDSKRLSACIGGLDRDVVPVAVDFAMFQNREAAIVLLPGRDGGYEVWAVDPTCGPDGDGVLGFSTLPAP